MMGGSTFAPESPMTYADYASRQRAIIAELAVAPDFDVDAEIERRVGFLAQYLRSTGLRTYVLGISGGVDSSKRDGSRNSRSNVSVRRI